MGKKGRITKSFSVTFKEGMDADVQMSGIWTRRELEVAQVLLRQELIKQLTKARNPQKEAQNG